MYCSNSTTSKQRQAAAVCQLTQDSRIPFKVAFSFCALDEIALAGPYHVFHWLIGLERISNHWVFIMAS